MNTIEITNLETNEVVTQEFDALVISTMNNETSCIHQMSVGSAKGTRILTVLGVTKVADSSRTSPILKNVKVRQLLPMMRMLCDKDISPADSRAIVEELVEGYERPNFEEFLKENNVDGVCVTISRHDDEATQRQAVVDALAKKGITLSDDRIESLLEQSRGKN